SHASWLAISEWIKRQRAVDVVTTKFSKSEIAAARWFELVPAWHHGYPQPDENASGYLNVTYDLGDYCQECGIGLKQKAPFRMKAEPVWGRNGVLQLNWIYDEFFAKPDVWKKIFEPYGVDLRPVLNTVGDELETVIQLVPTANEVDIATDELTAETCRQCGLIKYLPTTRGAFPRVTSEP